MLKHANLPDSFWAEAVATACYISNRTPTQILKATTLEELWSGKLATFDNIKVFGCRAYLLIQGKHKKLESKSFPCVYIGPSPPSPGYRLYPTSCKRLYNSKNLGGQLESQSPIVISIIRTLTLYYLL